MKYNTFKARCPLCDNINGFKITDEELENDYHYTCSKCKKESPISSYKEVLK